MSNYLSLTADVSPDDVARAVRWDRDMAFELIVRISEEIADYDFDKRVLEFFETEVANQDD